MELQLGLALPSRRSVKGFDLNHGGDEPECTVGSNHSSGRSSRESVCNDGKKKRRFSGELGREAPNKTLSLLLWNNQPNDEDDDPILLGKNPSTLDKNDGDCIVGWPPVKSWRKKSCDRDGDCRPECLHAASNRRIDGGSDSKIYVKVKMEGVGITRKIDLSLHHSYQTLAQTLMGMFGKCAAEAGEYKLAYQDREGDWLLAGDISWRNFARSVQRLKLWRCHV